VTRPAPGPTALFVLTLAALQRTGRTVTRDRELETVDVSAVNGDDTILGVVLPNANAVVFYSVWPETVVESARAAVGELVLRANTTLFTSALEFDPGTGTLSVRAGVALGDIQIEEGPASSADQLSRAAFGAMLTVALAEVELVRADYADIVAAVVGGAEPVVALGEGRRAARLLG
jgi:hypothetical protein